MAETVLNQQEAKLDPSSDTQRQNMFLKKIVGIILSILMVILTIFVLNLQNQNYNTLFKSTDMALSSSDHATGNYRTYVGRYKETRVELDETTNKLNVVKGQLDQVSTELATTKSMLAQTQDLLSDAQQENSKLKQELKGMDQLRVRNSQITLQLADLKKKLRVYDAQFSNLDEGHSLLILFQNKIRLVKSRMNNIKQEAFNARVAAQKEKDRIAALNGNSGFILRNGQAQGPNGTNKSFAIDVKIVQ